MRQVDQVVPPSCAAEWVVITVDGGTAFARFNATRLQRAISERSQH